MALWNWPCRTSHRDNGCVDSALHNIRVWRFGVESKAHSRCAAWSQKYTHGSSHTFKARSRKRLGVALSPGTAQGGEKPRELSQEEKARGAWQEEVSMP